MNIITGYNDWGHWDRLDDLDLVDREKLIVKWPDGQLEQVEITVKNRPFTVNDMGHQQLCPNKRAYVLKHYRGVQIEVPLLGLEAQRVT